MTYLRRSVHASALSIKPTRGEKAIVGGHQARFGFRISRDPGFAIHALRGMGRRTAGRRNTAASTLNRAQSLAIWALLGSGRLPLSNSDAAPLLPRSWPRSVTVMPACSTSIRSACVGVTACSSMGKCSLSYRSVSPSRTSR